MLKTRLGHVTDVARGSLHPLWAHVIHTAEELELYFPGLVSCYKEVFAGPPYFEDYTGQEDTFIRPSFRRFATDGVLVLLVTADDPSSAQVIGFGGSEPADQSESADFLSLHTNALEAPLDRYLYMAELGILPAFRRQGLGRRLITLRIEEARRRSCDFTHVVMRTAAEGSNSRLLYEALGARPVDGLVMKKDGFGTASTERIFLTMPIGE